MERFLNKEYLIVALLYLFQISAIVGITLGFFDWFVEKTPLVLVINLLSLVYFTKYLNKNFFIVSINKLHLKVYRTFFYIFCK